MDNRVLALVGSSGFLAREYLVRSKNDFTNVVQISSSRGDYDINNPQEIHRILEAARVTHILNFVALTDIEMAENNPNLAMKLNIEIPSVLQEWTLKNSAYLVHISTDHLYDGPSSKETDLSIQNVYAATKYLGDCFIDKEKSVILRTNFVGRSSEGYNRGLTDWIVDSAKKNEKISLFDDVWFNPLHLKDLCKIIDFCLRNECTGLYNVGSIGSISKADFALKIFEGLNLNYKNYQLVSQSSVISRGRRPSKMVMDIGVFQQKYNYEMPSIKNTLNSVIQDYCYE